MRFNKQNSMQLIQGMEQVYLVGVFGIWWENSENGVRGLKLYGRWRLCWFVVFLWYKFLVINIFMDDFFKYYIFFLIVRFNLCIICYLRISLGCLFIFQLYVYVIIVDGYVLEYLFFLVFKVEDDNDNVLYFENKVIVFNVFENCRFGKFVFQENIRFLYQLNFLLIF